MNPFLRRMSLRRRRLVFAALGVFAASLVLPGMGYLVRYYLATAGQTLVAILNRSDDGNTDDYGARCKQAFFNRTALDKMVAARMPDDFPVQLAACQRGVPDDYVAFLQLDADNNPLPPAANTPNEPEVRRPEKIAWKLLELAPRFDHSPAFHAAVLRNMSGGAVFLNHRHDDEIFYRVSAGKQDKPVLVPPSPRNLRAWHRAAQSGEQLEPQNAYFPLMDAAGFFAENRDKDALQALQRASRKSGYEDYAQNSAVGNLRLEEAEHGRQPALFHLSVQAMLTLPDYPLLRNMARLAAAKAVEAERQNRPNDGFRIREAVRRVGTNLRINNRGWFGMTTGENMVCSACLRPGGAALLAPTEPDQKKREAMVLANYAAYLRRTGHANEAQTVLREADARVQNEQLSRQVEDNQAYVMYLPRLLRLVILPSAALLLLMNALLVLIGGGLAALCTQNRRIARGLPLQKPVRAGMASAILLPLAYWLIRYGVPYLFVWGGADILVLLFAGVGAVSGLACWLLARRRRKGRIIGASPREKCGPVRRALLWAGGLLGTWALAFLLVFFAVAGEYLAWKPCGDLYLPLQDYRETGFFGYWLHFLAVFVLPLFFAFCAACSVKAGIPTSVGVVRGVRGLAVPVACLLVLLTIPLNVWLAFENAALNRDLERAARHEGRYMAEISGEPWPLPPSAAAATPHEGTRP